MHEMLENKTLDLLLMSCYTVCEFQYQLILSVHQGLKYHRVLCHDYHGIPKVFNELLYVSLRAMIDHA